MLLCILGCRKLITLMFWELRGTQNLGSIVIDYFRCHSDH